MLFLRLSGGLFLLLAAASGFILLANPIGFDISGSVRTVWVLFFSCLIGGLVLYSLGSKAQPVAKVFNIIGISLLLLGIGSAFFLFLSNVPTLCVEISPSLWALFFVGTLGGVAGILFAETKGDCSTNQILARAAARQLEKRFDGLMWANWGRDPLVSTTIRSFGGLAAARTILHQSSSPVFKRLEESNRLHLSIEATALEPRWHPLFTDLERELATTRLRSSGYLPSRAEA